MLTKRPHRAGLRACSWQLGSIGSIALWPPMFRLISDTLAQHE